MLRILGRNTSSNVQKVLWTAATLGVPFAREDVGGKHGRNREAEFSRSIPTDWCRPCSTAIW